MAETKNSTKKMDPIDDLLAKSWQTYCKYFWKFMGLLGIYVLPWIAMAVIFGLYAVNKNVLASNAIAAGIVNVILSLLMIFTIIFGIIVYFSAQSGLFLLIKKAKEKFSIKQAFSEGKTYAWRYFILGLLAGIFVLLWSLLFIIPGIVASIYYTFAFWVLFCEGLRGRAAITRSKQLVKGYWWPVFGRLMLVSLIVWIILGIPYIFMRTEEAAESWNQITNLISLIISPFFLAYSYYMYKNLVKIKGSTSKSK